MIQAGLIYDHISCVYQSICNNKCDSTYGRSDSLIFLVPDCFSETQQQQPTGPGAQVKVYLRIYSTPQMCLNKSKRSSTSSYSLNRLYLVSTRQI